MVKDSYMYLNLAKMIEQIIFRGEEKNSQIHTQMIYIWVNKRINL